MLGMLGSGENISGSLRGSYYAEYHCIRECGGEADKLILVLTLFRPRLVAQVLDVAPVTFVMTQQRTCAICSPKLIAIFAHLKKI